jgi:hypothetical protein
MPKLATGKLAVNWGWLVYRIVDGEAEFLGLYQIEGGCREGRGRCVKAALGD